MRGAGGGALRQRLACGTMLALALVALLLLDARLSRLVDHAEDEYPATLLRNWLCNGALSTAIVLLFTLAATRELIRFAGATGHGRPFAGVAYLFGAGLVVGPYVTFNLAPGARWHDESWGLMWIALALGLAFYLQAAYRRTELAMANLAVTVFIIVYAGGLAGYLTKLRMEVGGGQGIALLLFSVFVVKMTDVGAFFAGSLLGRRKLVPWLSPGKTWEGLIGGVLVAVLSAFLVGSWLHHAGWATLGTPAAATTPAATPFNLRALPWLAYPWGMAAFGLLMAGAGIAGDLFASLLKRDAALKDSGNAIPGMGGILDVLDSPLLAAPAAWFFWTRLAPLERIAMSG